MFKGEPELFKLWLFIQICRINMFSHLNYILDIEKFIVKVWRKWDVYLLLRKRPISAKHWNEIVFIRHPIVNFIGMFEIVDGSTHKMYIKHLRWWSFRLNCKFESEIAWKKPFMPELRVVLYSTNWIQVNLGKLNVELLIYKIGSVYFNFIRLEYCSIEMIK